MKNEEEFEQIFSSNVFALETEIFVNKGADYKGHWILCLKKKKERKKSDMAWSE